jgi:tripartite ATP-independent transporter DctM subunit
MMTYSLTHFAGLIVAMMLLLTTGMPVAFALGGVGLLVILVFWGPPGLMSLSNSIWSTFCGDNYVAIPMFLFMANVLEKSGIADELYDMLFKWMGGIRGGLAMGTIIICSIFAAMCGGSGAATITMGLIALPSMLNRGYDKHLAMGCIAAGGVLGIVIPPSIPMVILAQYGAVSVGKLFFGGVLPGILSAAIYIAYIAIRCAIDPDLCPVVPEEERGSFNEKLIASRAVLAPALLILCVLGSIWLGLATPVEAAGVGAFASLIIAAFKRKLTYETFTYALQKTLRLIGMILWILTGATVLNTSINYLGAGKLIRGVAAQLPGGSVTVIFCMMALNFVLGCLMDDYAVITLTAPLYIPLIISLGVDPLWFGVMFILNLQMAYLTPPYGFNLFFLKSIVPKEIKLPDIYRSVVPFVALQMLVLAICWAFPQIITFLPNSMIK